MFLQKKYGFFFCALNRDVFAFVLLYTNKVMLVRAQMDIDRMFFYICPKVKKIQDIRENFFAYVHDTFVPYYPKGIADSWAQEDRLGEELLEILDAYMKF